MSDELRPPILLFGNTRSGATIIQKTMSAHPDITGWYEPNALWLYADPGRIYDEFDESDATEPVKRYIRSKFLKYQKKHGNRIILEKTPQNILRIPYVRAIFPEAIFLFIVRNPFSFISSVELKWQRTVTRQGIIRRLKDTPPTQLHHWVRRYLRQQISKRLLKKKYLSIWGPRYRGIYDDLKTHDMLTVIARQWSVCSRKAEDALAKFDDSRVLRLKYEEFVENPFRDIERICNHCGFAMTDGLEQAAKGLVKTDRLLKWQRFDPEDLSRILPEIEEEMQRHGYTVPEEISHTVENPAGIIRESLTIRAVDPEGI
jgi:hypothetical protein